VGGEHDVGVRQRPGYHRGAAARRVAAMSVLALAIRTGHAGIGLLYAVLFVVAASAPFFVNAGTCAASALLIGLVAGTYRSSGSGPAAAGGGEPRATGLRLARSVRADVAEGFRWLIRQRLTPPDLLGRVGSTILFIAAGGNCVGAVLGGVIATKFGLTAPYWVGFVVAIIVSALTWRVFDRATVARAYAQPAPREP
jgi:hypothetical protein